MKESRGRLPSGRRRCRRGELVLQEHEWEFIERMETEHPGFTDDYLEQRRKAAEKVFDPRSNLERIVALLESVQRAK